MIRGSVRMRNPHGSDVGRIRSGRDQPRPGVDGDEKLTTAKANPFSGKNESSNGRGEILTVIRETTRISSTLYRTLYPHRRVRRWAGSPSTAALVTGTLNAFMRKNEVSDQDYDGRCALGRAGG